MHISQLLELDIHEIENDTTRSLILQQGPRNGRRYVALFPRP
jgi:hypothetical protein